MTDLVIVKEPVLVVTIQSDGLMGPPGSTGPPGANGLGAISSDAGNAITTGVDGGLYCPAVVQGVTHW